MTPDGCNQSLPSSFFENSTFNILVDDVRFVEIVPSHRHSEQNWRISLIYYLVQLASRHDCLVHPPCSHADELWLQLVEGGDPDHDVWLWQDGDEAWIQDNAPITSDWWRLDEGQLSAANRALHRRLERMRRASHLTSNDSAITSRNARIRAATPGQRLAAIIWLIYTSKYREDLDYRCGWSSRLKFSLGELIQMWREAISTLCGAIPFFPEQPEGWNRFMQGREAMGCACMDSHLFREPLPDWLRMVTWLQNMEPAVDFLDRYKCRPCRDRASTEYDAFYGTDDFWDTPPVPMLLIFSLEALSFLDDYDQHIMLPFVTATVSKSLLPGSKSTEDANLRSIYDERDKDVELSPWVNSHPRIGREYLQRYACYLGPFRERAAGVNNFMDDYLEILPGAFAQGAPNAVVLIGTLAWILGSRFLSQSTTDWNWHDYWGKVLEGSFLGLLCVQKPGDTTRVLGDELKRSHCAMRCSGSSSELKWHDDLWINYAAILEFVKSRIPESKFKGCQECHAVYLSVVSITSSSHFPSRNDSNVDPLQEHFGHVPNLTSLIKRLDMFPAARGGNADIYKCRLREESGRYINVAVKVFRPDFYIGPQQEIPKGLRREIKVWHVLRHRNIVPLLGVVNGFGPTVSAVSPWISGGPLRTYLEGRCEELALSDRFDLIQDVAEGIKCLHSFPIVHGDLSDSNVLVETDGTARLTDFGLCTVIGGVSGGSSMIRRTVCPGTIPFAAPELVLNDDATSPSMMSDMYSLGCIMLQVLSGRQPWEKATPPMIIIALSKGECVPRPKHRPIRDRDWAFIQRCCSSPNLRPSATDVLDYISVTRASSHELDISAALVDSSSTRLPS